VTNVLIDTHTFLWFIEDSPKLSPTARYILENEAEITYLSIVSLWEMAIKICVNKLNLPRPFETYIPEQLSRNALTILDLKIEHTAMLITMPLHHREPHDRTIAAQALIEELPLLSADAKLDAYGLQRIW
jgi:PIN domain nuclease of toxin-antitoxin system